MTRQGTLLLIGGTSDIGRATALRYAEAGWRVMLTARDEAEGLRNADDIGVRTSSEATVHRLDILETERFEDFVDHLPVLPDAVICVVGTLGDQQIAEREVEHGRLLLRTNFEGPALLLGIFADRFAARGTGVIVGVSSVAGDRGRASNYYYGAAKAGFTAFLSGLRNRLSRTGVRVVTVKPGFVRTKMTAGIRLPGPLTASPEAIGRAIFAAAEAGRADVVYLPRVWRPIMAMIRMLPEAVFKKLRL